MHVASELHRNLACSQLWQRPLKRAATKRACFASVCGAERRASSYASRWPRPPAHFRATRPRPCLRVRPAPYLRRYLQRQARGRALRLYRTASEPPAAQGARDAFKIGRRLRAGSPRARRGLLSPYPSFSASPLELDQPHLALCALLWFVLPHGAASRGHRCGRWGWREAAPPTAQPFKPQLPPK
jgi:hypothetical protein